MDITISGRLSGSVTIPPSKSIAHRALICAALADEPSTFLCGEHGDDVTVTAHCLSALGATVKYSDDSFRVWPVTQVSKRPLLDCEESGSTLRFLLPVAAVLGADATFEGRGRLSERPLSPLYEEMVRHGVHMTPQGEFPLVCNGKLSGGEYNIDAGISSQFISGLLFALPLAEEDSTVRLTGILQSASYVNLTINALMHAGISIHRTEDSFIIPGRQRYSAITSHSIEGDWSSAAFWLVAAAIGTQPICCRGIDFERSMQGDKAVVGILRSMNAEIRASEDCVTAYPSELRGTEIDCTDIPDLVPALAVAAACASGRTVFNHVSRLRMKESDRIETVISMLYSFGIHAESTDDTLTVTGGRPQTSGTVESHADHRIAMAAAILASVCDSPVTICGAECVSKSYPSFFNDFVKLGGSIR